MSVFFFHCVFNANWSDCFFFDILNVAPLMLIFYFCEAYVYTRSLSLSAPAMRLYSRRFACAIGRPLDRHTESFLARHQCTGIGH